MATDAVGVYHHHDPVFLSPAVGARALTPAAVPAAVPTVVVAAAAAQAPTLPPLSPIISFSEYLYTYSPISTLEILDSRLYPALNSTLHQFIATTTVPNPVEPLQLATLILVTAASLLTFSTYVAGRRFTSGGGGGGGGGGGRRYSRRGKRRAATTTLGKKTSFRVQELYESNVLVAVADVPRGQPQHGGGDGGDCDEYNKESSSPSPKPQSQQRSLNARGLVTKEKFLRAEEDSQDEGDSGWFRDAKTRVLLLARPPVGLLK